MDYQTLDTIADSYTPIIAVIAIMACAAIAPQNAARLKMVMLRFAGLVLLVIVAYGLMLLDNALNVWPGFGLDYSTHTAVALVLIVFLMGVMPRWRIFWGLSLVAYCGLMLYQEYHSLSDIVTTAIAVLGAVVLLFAFLWFIDVRALQNTLGVARLFANSRPFKTDSID